MRSTRWNLLLPLIALVAAFCTASVVAVYFWRFHGALSVDPDAWGNFGDFVGGTLGPLLAFLSFIALLITIKFQLVELRNSAEALTKSAQELEQTRVIAGAEAERQARDVLKADLFQVVHMVHGELESVFQRKAEFSSIGNSIGHYFSASAPSKGEADVPTNGQSLSPTDRTSILDLFERMSELDNYLNQYEMTFGASAVTYYFRRRYMTARRVLVAKEFASDQMWLGFKSPGFGWSAPINSTSARSEGV